MSSKRRIVRSALACLVASGLATGVAACGGSSSSGGNSAGGSSSSKGTLKIFLSYPAGNQIADYSDMLPAAQAAVAAVNKAGGVNGQKLELESCNNRADQGQSLTCARNAIEDKAVAFVGQSDLFTTQTMPLLEEAHIASIGLFSFGNPVDYQSKNSFPLNGGSIQGYLGAPKMLQDLGFSKFSVEGCDYPSCQESTNNLKKVAPKTTAADVGNVTVPNTGVTDYSSYAAKAKALNAPAAIQIVSPTPSVGLMSAGKSIGYSPQYIGNDQMTGEVAGSTGSGVYQGFMLSGPFPSPRSQNIPAMKQYIAERAALSNETPAKYLATTKFGASWANSLDAWLSVHAFAQVAAKIKGSVTAQSVLSYLQSDNTPVDLYGLETWTPGASGSSQYPRFAAMENYAVQLVDGKLTTVSKVAPFNVLTAIGAQ